MRPLTRIEFEVSTVLVSIMVAFPIMLMNADQQALGLSQKLVSSSASPSQSSTVTLTSTLVVTAANDDQTFSNYKISSSSGDCVLIQGATNVTFDNSEVGPCGTNNTTSLSNGIHITASRGINVYDSYIHVENLASGCCDTHDGILVESSSNINIQGNVIAYNESNVELTGGGVSSVKVIGNYLLNPRGPYPRGQNFQSWGTSNNFNSSITVSNNYALSCTIGGAIGIECPATGPRYLYSEVQEDSINFGFTNGFVIESNYVKGGHSPSGCGLIADDSANSGHFLSNIIFNTGQCGIGIATGTNHLVSGNRILNLNPIDGAGNTALYLWNQYSSSCSGIIVSNNTVSGLKFPIGCNPSVQSCSFSSFWNAGNCGAVSASGNTFDNRTYSAGGGPAFRALNSVVPSSAPLIPPLPKNCVARSPHSNQTSLPACK